MAGKMDEKILHVGSPQMGSPDELMKYIRQIYEKNWFTNNGELVRELERRIRNLLRVRHCIATVNGTIALQIAAKACDIRGGIIVPAFTFPATAYAFLWMGHQVHLCDIDPITHHMDYEKLDSYLSAHPNISGIVPVHIWGEICDAETIAFIAEKHKCVVIYDAAHAFLNSDSSGEYVGGKGACEVFSFHATKFFNTVEGGAILTNSDEIAERSKLLRNFGFVDVDDIRLDGINGKMHELSAAVGLTNLARIHEIRSACMNNYHMYKSILDSLQPGIKLRNVAGENDQHPTAGNYQYVVMEIDEEITGVGRDSVLAELVGRNILARRYFWPGIHNLPPFKEQGWSMPGADKAASRVLCLPTGINVGPSDIYRVCNAIIDALRSKT